MTKPQGLRLHSQEQQTNRAQSIEQALDVRLLEAPEPFQKVMQALVELPEGQVLRMIHRREPFPLFKVLLENNWHYRTLNLVEGEFDILIWRADDGVCEAYCSQAKTALPRPD